MKISENQSNLCHQCAFIQLLARLADSHRLLRIQGGKFIPRHSLIGIGINYALL
jgi:hypothetical protein